jgi:hypothetical protein
LAAIAAAISGYFSGLDGALMLPLAVSAVFATMHSATTAIAAPTAFAKIRVNG